MKQLWTEARKQIVLYWGVVFYVVLFSLLSLADAIILALYSVIWDGLWPQEKFVICLLIFKNWGTCMVAFFNRAAAKVQQGQLPISPDDTSLLPSANPPKP